MSEAFSLRRLRMEGREHWKRHLPQLYQQLKEAGQLEQALTEAAKQTRALMDQYNDRGMTDQEAWPEVRAEFLILDPMGPSEPEPLDSD